MTEFLFLLGAHFLADYPLQGEYIVIHKGKDDYLLLAHSFIYSFLVGVTLLYFELFAPWKFLLLLISHFIVDRLKSRHTALSLRDDQLLHFVVLALVRWLK